MRRRLWHIASRYLIMIAVVLIIEILRYAGYR